MFGTQTQVQDGPILPSNSGCLKSLWCLWHPPEEKLNRAPAHWRHDWPTVGPLFLLFTSFHSPLTPLENPGGPWLISFPVFTEWGHRKWPTLGGNKEVILSLPIASFPESLKEPGVDYTSSPPQKTRHFSWCLILVLWMMLCEKRKVTPHPDSVSSSPTVCKSQGPMNYFGSFFFLWVLFLFF